MIEFQHVSFSYEKERSVLEDLSFRIGPGESVGLIGANGAGKSTVMKLALGLLSGEGRILADGIEVNRANLADVRRRIGFVLQNSDNQMFMPTVYEDMIFAPLNYGLSREEAEQRVDKALGQLGLQELKYRHNHRISGGEKRMAAIATILAMEPDRIVINTIRGLKQTKLIASHDLDMILDTCERVILLDRGRIVADGPADEILRNRELLEAHRMELPFCLAGEAAGKDPGSGL